MLKNLELLNKEGGNERICRTPEKCPVCYSNEKGVLCDEHEVLLHDFDKLRSYINNLERYDENTVYILSCAIGNRVSYVINDVPYVNGRLDIEGYLKKKIDSRLEDGKEVKMSLWMEQILREILALKEAKCLVMKIMNGK